MSSALPVDPKAVEKMKKTMAKEAKVDEKEYGRALKELKSTEKSEAKAYKAISKADKHLKKMEDNEHDTIRSLQKATHKHDKAVRNLHIAQSKIQIKDQHADELKCNVQTLRVRTEELFNAKRAREEERSRKLANLQDLNHNTAPTG